jgi:hypothetical protein
MHSEKETKPISSVSFVGELSSTRAVIRDGDRLGGAGVWWSLDDMPDTA